MPTTRKYLKTDKQNNKMSVADVTFLTRHFQATSYANNSVGVLDIRAIVKHQNHSTVNCV